MIKTRDNYAVSVDKIGYFTTINTPPTELSTVHDLRCRSVSIQQELQLENIAVNMGQVLYAKAT